MTKQTINHNPKAFTTHKKHKPKPQLGITESMLFSKDYYDLKQALKDDCLVHLSFDCPKQLRDAFNWATKANGTSTCKMLQQLALNYTLATMVKKHALANTNLSPEKEATVVNLNIGDMNFEQYVQNRPRRLIANHNVDAVVNGPVVCGIGSCGKKAVDVAVYVPSGVSYDLCSFHAGEYSGVKAWSFQK